jgi:hypothetical protein
MASRSNFLFCAIRPNSCDAVPKTNGQCAAQLGSIAIRYLNISFMTQRLNQRIAGTVIAKASVETRSIEAASDSKALYRAAKSTTTVARGKLQHTSASRANGLTTCKRCNRANRTADCTVTRATEPTNITDEKRTGCAAKIRPTAKTATPEVAEPISSKQLATTAGRWMLARTTAIPRIGAHRSGDFTPAFNPATRALGFEGSVATR